MVLWKGNKENLYKSISNISGLKSCYHGDISPSQCFDLISRTALYVDTTLIPDPLTKLLTIPDKMIKERYLVYYVVKHTFNVLNAQEFFFSETEVPISVIYPLDIYFDEKRNENCVKEAALDTKEYFEELLDTKFDSKEQLDSVLDHDTRFLASEIKRPQALPPSFQNLDDVSKGLEKARKEMSDTGMLPIEGKPTGICLKYYVLGNLVGLSSKFLDCISFDSKPLFDVPNSWFMFKWKLKKGIQQIAKELELDVSTAVINALQLDSFKWLGNVPPDKLVQLRNNHELQDLRDLFSREVSEMYQCNRDELEIVAARVRHNLTQAFKKHEQEIKNIESEYATRYNIDGSLVITGAIGTIVGLLWPPAALASIVVGSGSLLDLKRIDDKHKKKILETTNKPIGILFDAHEKGEHL